MTKTFAPGPPSSRGRGSAPVVALLALAFAVGAAPAQEVRLIGPADGSGPGIDLWIESPHPDLDFGYHLSERAYVAVFEVIPGLGATLVWPDRERGRAHLGSGRLVGTGTHYGTLRRNDRAFQRTLAGRHLSARHGYGLHGPDRGYLLLVASRVPLDLWRFGRLDDYRYTPSGLAGQAAFDRGPPGSLERLVRRVVAEPDGGGWSAAYVSYSLLRYADRFAGGYGTSTCFGFLPGFTGFGFLPIGSYRHGGFGLGFPSFHFPGFRGLGGRPFGHGFVRWSHPFGFGASAAHGAGCGFGFSTFPFHLPGAPLFPRRPEGPRSEPPVGDGRGTATIPPPPIHPRTPVPPLAPPVGGERASGPTDALLRAPVPARKRPGVLVPDPRRAPDNHRVAPAVPRVPGVIRAPERVRPPPRIQSRDPVRPPARVRMRARRPPDAVRAPVRSGSSGRFRTPSRIRLPTAAPGQGRSRARVPGPRRIRRPPPRPATLRRPSAPPTRARAKPSKGG